MIEIANAKTVKQQPGRSYIYVGRGRAPAAPAGMEHAHLGNPFRVGADFAQGEAAAAYLPHLRSAYLRRGPERTTLEKLARRYNAGEQLVLVCWCAPKPNPPLLRASKQSLSALGGCHAQHIRQAILGIASKLQ